MSKDCIAATEEYVKLSRKNYDQMKNGYNDGYKTASDETLELIEHLEDRNEKLQSAICVVNVYIKNVWNAATSDSDTIYKSTPDDVKVVNEKSELYKELYNHFVSLEEAQKSIEALEYQSAAQKERIAKFKNSRIGRFLNFFGVKI